MSASALPAIRKAPLFKVSSSPVLLRVPSGKIRIGVPFYLFVIISLSVVNAIAASVSIVELLVTNIIVVDAIWLCEHRLKLEPSKLVQYDRLELIKPDRSEDLKADLEMRLGLKVRKVEVGAIDMLRDMAVLRVYYDANTVSNTVDEKMKLNRADLVEV